MPQVNVWTRCGCPGDAQHPRAACPRLGGFEQATGWVCLQCLRQCDLIIIPDSRQPWKDWNGQSYLRLQEGRVITGSQGRAGDADRNDGFAKLEDAYEQGRLSLEEFEHRLDVIGDAELKSDIRAALADLA